MMRKMQHFYIITRSWRVVSQCVLYERWCYSSLEAVRALEAPFRGYARRLFLGGHKIEEMLFRTFVFASVLNDAQSLLSSLQHSNKANADFLPLWRPKISFLSFCSARSTQMKESVSMGQIDTAKGITFGSIWLL